MALTRPKAAQIDFDVTNLTDPLIGLNSGESGSADKDSGIVIERGSDTNVAFIWDESADQFAVVNTDETGTTSGNVTISSYADIKANSFYGDGSNLTGISGGGGAFTAESDGASLTDTSTGSSAGPVITLTRNPSDNAGSDADYLGQLKFKGDNDAGQSTVFAKITGKILDASDGTEDGILEFAHQKAGSNVITGRWRSDSLQLLNGTTLVVSGLTYPTSDGTNGQALTTDGSGTLSFSDVASNLNGLSDVTISSVQNNDLLKYNSTAGEWQNTNLGISVAPTLSVVSGTTYVGGAVVVNITNNASGGSNVYDDPHFFVQLKNSSSSVVVTNDNITYEYSSNQGKLSFTAPTTAGSYTLEVTAQDFGDLESDVTTLSLTVNEIPAFRYMRLKGDGGSSHTYVQEFRAFDALGQSGTKYPPNLSSTNQGSTETVDGVDYVANSSGNFSSTYHDYKAFDSSASTGWWNLNPSSTYSDWFVSIDLGQSVSGIKSFQVFINQSYVGGSGNVVKIQISSTGNFSGEEITVGQYTPHLVESTGINNAQRRFFIG